MGVSESVALPNDTILPGGTLALKLQSACPFRAFAEIRLKAKPLKKPSLGLNEAERGEIIHQILQDFWKDIKSQAKLLSLTQSAVEQLLSNITQSVFDLWQERNARLLKPRYRTIEQKRILKLLSEYINLERERAPFEMVAEEVLEVVNLGALRFFIRIDRIDKIESGEEILIDYKTGKVSISDWFGVRPNNPQLPTYCLTRNPKPSALAFAIIRPESIHYSGLIDENIVGSSSKPIPGLKTAQQMNRSGSEPTWHEQCQTWKTTIERLGKDFSEGIADVDPKDGANTCRTCSLQMLCRIS